VTDYYLLLHDSLREDINQLSAAYKADPNSPAGREYVGVINGLKALQSGRESAYEGKQLGYGPQSHDLRDCAELKVPVTREFTPGGHERGPSHRLIYREFQPLDRVEDGRVVRDPNAKAYRQAVAFAHRSTAGGAWARAGEGAVRG
jgi:hypothetical protein